MRQSMRKRKSGERLNTKRAFSLDRISNINNYETGISGTLGFDFKIKKNTKTKFDFSVAQVVVKKKIKRCQIKAV